MTLMLIVRWFENDSYFEDYKIIGKEIPENIAFQIVKNGDGEIVEIDEDNDFEEDTKPKYHCPICKSNHFLDSEIGREHLHHVKKENTSMKKNFMEKVSTSYSKSKDIHIYTQLQIPKDISPENAEKMVNDQKATYI